MMKKTKAGSYSQIYIQLVIPVRFKKCGLSKELRTEVFKIMGAILNDFGHKPIIINGVYDHVHLFFGMNPNISLSETTRELKRRTSLFINSKGYFSSKFRWQIGYGAFSYGRSQMKTVYNYIERQEEHHSRRSFKDEYISFLEKFHVEYDQNYLFNWDLE